MSIVVVRLKIATSNLLYFFHAVEKIIDTGSRSITLVLMDVASSTPGIEEEEEEEEGGERRRRREKRRA